jgi:ABC-type sugar transport system ATPase subunit
LIFILDEPTASLTEKETKTLFAILRTLRDKGVSIIYVSHRIEEVFQLADRITILKDGKFQGTFLKEDLTHDQLINRMVGREIAALKTESHVREKVLLDVTGLRGKRFNNISFQLKAGEILGIAGLVGAGRTELARAIFGADEILSGHIVLKDKPFKPSHPSDAVAKGLVYVPEERKSLGLFQEMTVQDNIISGNLKNALEGNFYSYAKANRLAGEAKDKLRIATPSVEQKVVNLSGGNQQKVVLSKWLLTNPDVLIVDEPTHGIDVGAKFEIYEILKALASQGKGIIMISSDLPELLGISDRILILKRGTIAGILSRSEATEERIMSLASN